MTLGKYALLLSLLGILLPLHIFSTVAKGCASCGSGGDDPLILYPNERHKVFVGLGSMGGFRNIGPSGEILTAGGPTRRYTTTMAIGHSFSPRSFATLTVPYIRNVRDGETRAGMGDPSLSARYTLLMPSIVDPWIPQVQVFGGYRTGSARSLRNTEDPKTLLDVMGTGFAEGRGGVDLWYGQFATLFGLAHIVSYPLAQVYEQVSYQPGLAHRSTLTVGYRWLPHVKTLIGTNREAHEPINVAGNPSRDSDQLNYSTFLTQDYMLDQLKMLRLTASQMGAYGPIKNGVRASTVMVAYMQAF